jgi:dihydroxy-acid dehydratase
MTEAAFKNAITVLAAEGGSTNAIVHLLAVARRLDIDISLDDFDQIAASVPLLVDCKPSGSVYMEDFHHAGGVPVLMKALETLLDTSTVGLSGQTLAELLAETPPPQPFQSVIGTLTDPVGNPGALAVLRGSLAPDGAVIKVSAASAGLLSHEGPALVFDSPEDAAARLDDPELDVTPGHVLVLRNSGPIGAGMPEAGSLPIPKRLAAMGVTDMVRVSDARMSGTSYGTVVLHCAPESAAGGPLALVHDGDIIRLDVPGRRIDLLVDDDELARRRLNCTPFPIPARGWRRLFVQSVLQANEGADLDFLAGPRGGSTEPGGLP